MRIWLKRAVAVLLALGAGGAAVLAFLPQPVRVDVAPVVRGPLRVAVEGTGHARVRRRYVLAAPVTGQLARVALRAGDAVAEGQVVASVAPPASPLLDSRTLAELEARVAAAEAAERQALATVEQAQLARTQAHRERERARDMVASGTLTRQALDAAEFELRARSREVAAAELGVETARRQVDAVRAMLPPAGGPPAAPAAPESVPVRAPAGGRVLRVYQENEGPVAAGTPLLEIGDPAALEVVVDLLTADAVRVRPGAAAELDGFGGAAPLRGVVRLVEPSAFTKISALGIEEQRVLVVIDPAGDAAGWSVLGDGYRVDARILVWEAPAVLRVPAGALFRDREDWSAFVLVDGRARLRRIRIDHRAEGEVEVVDGLREGERVILHPSDRVSDGAEVEAD